MKIILPMAGNGQRFIDAGYSNPKPLIDIDGKPMFVRVLENIKYGTDVHVIVRRDHVEENNIDTHIKEACPDATVHVLHEPTEGAACTVLEAINPYSNDGFLVANCDQLMVWNKSDFFEADNTEGTIFTFIPDHDKPIHSYVKVDNSGYITELAEKKMISNIATVGVYHFASEKRFFKAAHKMMDANDRTNGEFYLAPVYNYLDEKVKEYRVDKFLGMGTPEELAQFKNSEWWSRLSEL